MTIYFYKEFGPLGYLASYYPEGFYSNGIYYKTIEHYYQSHKFEDSTIVSEILNADTPKIASNIGRDRKNVPRKDWFKIKNDVMYEAVKLRFLANKESQRKLIETGNNDIVEKTTKENYWGCGPNMDGKNIYGKILCKVRAYLQKEASMKYLVSRAGYEKLKNSLSEIDNAITDTQRKMGESVKIDNDLRENPEFMDLRVKAMYSLPAEKEKITEMLQNAVIIEDTDEVKNADDTYVYVGSKVEIDYDGEIEEYTILGSSESDSENNIISCDSPIAEELIGKKVNEEFDFRDMEIKVLSVTRALQF